MTKLHEFAQRLPEESVLSKDEITSIKGGKRFRTFSRSTYLQVRNILRAQGYFTRMLRHGNEYCLEW